MLPKWPPRQVYLESIGLTRLDPFATPVAEQELALFSDLSNTRSLANTEEETRPSAFFEFFTPPPLRGDDSHRSARALLREKRPTIVYGDPGSGKTTLRYVLEADCRRESDQTLVISYPLVADLSQPPSALEHLNSIAEALSVDLFVQVIEQFTALHTEPTPDQIEALRAQLGLGGRALRRLAQRILDEPEPEALLGLSIYWRSVNRLALKRVVGSTGLSRLLQQCLENATPTKLAGQASLVAGLAAAQTWGFSQAFLLVDGVDTRRLDVNFMLSLVKPLLDRAAEWQTQRLILKMFLPKELAPAIREMKVSHPLQLTSEPIELIINGWDEMSLRRLLAERFRVGGSRRVGFDSLAGLGLEKHLDASLIHSAQGSPRRLLQIASCLIDAHAARDPYDQRIDLVDWNRMQALWSFEPPVPSAPINV